MEELKKVVCCVGNPHLCHIAEAYLRYFSRGRVIVSYPQPNHQEIHPRILETLLDDGIDWREGGAHVAAVSKEPDFLLVFGSDGKDGHPFNGVPRIEHHISPVQDNGLLHLDFTYLTKLREEVKKAVLKFIGKEL